MRIQPTLVFCLLLVLAYTGSAQVTMSDARFAGMKGNVKSVRSERTFRVVNGKAQKSDSQTDFFDEKGFGYKTIYVRDVETHRLRRLDGNRIEVSKVVFDAAGSYIPFVTDCPSSAVKTKPPTDTNFDYFVGYDFDALRRISTGTLHCGESTVLGTHTFAYDSDSRIRYDSRCDSTGKCNNSYYEYVGGVVVKETEITSIKGVEKCMSITHYSAHEFDSEGNTTKRKGVTSDCSDTSKILYDFVEVSTLEYHQKIAPKKSRKKPRSS